MAQREKTLEAKVRSLEHRVVVPRPMPPERRESKAFGPRGVKASAPTDGLAFIQQALSPATAPGRPVGWPDGTNVRGLGLSYVSTARIVAPPGLGEGKKWTALMSLMASPTSPFWIATGETGANVSTYTPKNILNIQITENVAADNCLQDRVPANQDAETVNTHSQLYQHWLERAERWRCVGASVTIVPIVNAVTNEGMISAVQTPISTRSFYPAAAIQSAAGEVGTIASGADTIFFQSADVPSTARISANPRSIKLPFAEGLYMPLKLGLDAQHWHTADDSVMVGDTLRDPYYTGNETSEGWAQLSVGPGTKAGGFYPFPTLVPASYAPAVASKLSGGMKAVPEASNSKVFGDITSPLCNDNVGHIVIDELNPLAGFEVKVVTMWEVEVISGGEWVQFTSAAPFDDIPEAIEVYSKVSRRMLDAFPASYNDLGAIWKVISKVGSFLAPAVGMIPVVGPILKSLINGAVAGGDAAAAGKSGAQQLSAAANGLGR